MGYPYVSGHPDYGRAGSAFVPEVWAGKALEKFYAATVLGEIANTDYEGEIKEQGDKVIVRTVPSITIREHKIGQTLVTERPTSVPVELNIDKGYYFDFVCDDVIKKQSDIAWMEKWAEDAGEQMKIKIDNLVLNSIYADAAAKNKGDVAGVISGGTNLGKATAPVQITKSSALDFIIEAGIVLDEQNRPETDRWMVLPAWFIGMIKLSDIKDASITGDGQSVLRNGRIGRIDRWTIYASNNITPVVDTVNCWHALAGHKSALTFASQMTNMETLRAESTFGTIVRGLNVFGYKVMQGESLLDLYVKR